VSLYLDTHIIVWLASGDQTKLTAAASQEIENSDIRISPIVLLELEYLREIERIIVPVQEIISKLQLQIGAIVCDFSFPAIIAAALDEKWTRDPFDRMIVAHARANRKSPLISSDEEIRKHYPGTIW
jgi:PIN domain nuclease of toxin-antitoxin system